ncbi:hypothetical protein PZN02_001605 [Sinorhizobium garamanticum]|uniref:Transmembrane protein n=1 Tax=Sinorhizobium garamanticum TaxID=680247 RepID=A0ABY8DG41_9HYPH|nr:hypothetical protein [Sinorhizobium garamanticum]WEX89063.1 hypothetical protein PZN02_001605 [Sinorhizobium garamanticum]
MRALILTFLRLGPCGAYALAAMFLCSMVLLAHYPASEFAWWLYMTILPVMREPVFMLLAVPGIGLWGAAAILVLTALFGILLAIRPERYQRMRFVHAHVALIATALTAVRAVQMQAGLSGLSLPEVLRGDWSFLPLAYSPLGTVLFLFVLAACVCSHAAIIRRIRVR